MQHLGTSSTAFVDGAAFSAAGIAAQRAPVVLDAVASASLFQVGERASAHFVVRRGRAWGCSPSSLSADSAHLLYHVLSPLFSGNSFFARKRMADVASDEHFAGYGLWATRAVKAAVEELGALGVVGNSIEWRGSLFPVRRLRHEAPTRSEMVQIWGASHDQHLATMRGLEEVASFFDDARTCLWLRLCVLFGNDEGVEVSSLCHCYVCSPACPSLG